MKAKRVTEYIDMQTVDWWVCLCGNRPDYEGFFPCNEDGEPVEPTPAEWTTDCYVCDRCQRIINRYTGEVQAGRGPRYDPQRLLPEAA